MGIIDIIILACFVPSVVIGFKKGLVDQVISLAVVLGGIWLSLHFSDSVGNVIGGIFGIKDSFWMKAIAFILIFVVVAIVLNLLGGLLKKLMEITMIGGINSIFGALLGFVKAAFILGIIAYFINSANELAGFLPAEKMAESKFFSPLLEFAKALFPLLKELF